MKASRAKAAIRVIPATEAKTFFGQVLKRVYEQNETQVVERAGMPVAVIISIDEYMSLQPERAKQLPEMQTSARRQRAHKELIKFLDEMGKGSEQFTEEEVEADVLKALEEVRYGKKK